MTFWEKIQITEVAIGILVQQHTKSKPATMGSKSYVFAPNPCEQLSECEQRAGAMWAAGAGAGAGQAPGSAQASMGPGVGYCSHAPASRAAAA